MKYGLLNIINQFGWIINQFGLVFACVNRELLAIIVGLSASSGFSSVVVVFADGCGCGCNVVVIAVVVVVVAAVVSDKIRGYCKVHGCVDHRYRVTNCRMQSMDKKTKRHDYYELFQIHYESILPWKAHGGTNQWLYPCGNNGSPLLITPCLHDMAVGCSTPSVHIPKKVNKNPLSPFAGMSVYTFLDASE